MKSQIMKTLKRFALLTACLPALAFASSEIKLDSFTPRTDGASLQNGAKIFVNYCLNCHSASFVRYNRLAEIGLTESQIKDNLLFASEKTGELMKVAMQPLESREWFGATPPDLSLVARARASESGSGAQWLYTYLRSFYRDQTRPTGWNNAIFENVGMPHVLWQLQGDQTAHITKVQDAHGGESKHIELKLDKPGTMTPEAYDKAVGDLVSYMVWMADPVSEKRNIIGAWVLAFLAGAFVVSYLLKKNFWKDIH